MNMQSLMQQAQKMQRELQKAQAELAKQEFKGTNGGAVAVTILGNRQVTQISIEPELLNPEDRDLIAEMIKNAVNAALAEIALAEAAMNERITGRSGGMGF
jgi:nucleoid-associated protein EbfC